MKLIEALSILSKSSPYAVSTERSTEDKLSSYKKYIYIETEIQKDFEKALKSAKPEQIVFLCGSSGDGKSEILTKYSQGYKARCDFHLDATHSFSPDQTAIQALNDRFTSFKLSDKPLIVGINIGMLGNYAEEGDEEHEEIKAAIHAFLERRKADISDKFVFLDFEDYPKFNFAHQGIVSEFAADFLDRLTIPDLDTNPFYALYLNEVEKSGHTDLTANFALLSKKSVQESIISLLLKARLIKDQFLTARALLDFVFQLLAAKSLLFDTLFSGGDNELLTRIQSFDPSNQHTRKIDEFVLQYGLGIECDEFCEFKNIIRPLGIFEVASASSFLRLFYLLQGDSDITNGFVTSLQSEFANSLVEQYAMVWMAHAGFDGSGKQKKALHSFYKETLISAIHCYCNRNAPLLVKDEYLISQFNGFKTAVSLDVKPAFSSIQGNALEKIGTFNAYIQVDGKTLLPMPISINLMELLVKINQGYRPNKHDKNAVILLDEVLDQILSVANSKDTIFIVKADRRYKVVNQDNEYFEVSGI